VTGRRRYLIGKCRSPQCPAIMRAIIESQNEESIVRLALNVARTREEQRRAYSDHTRKLAQEKVDSALDLLVLGINALDEHRADVHAVELTATRWDPGEYERDPTCEECGEDCEVDEMHDFEPEYEG
jgi:hypothetical protein